MVLKALVFSFLEETSALDYFWIKHLHFVL